MRVILSGGGNPEYVVPLDKLFLSQIDLQKTVLYIPVAMEPHVFSYGECYEWIQKTYRPYGIINIEMCTNLNAVELENKYTAIFIGGGNTFKLLKEIKDSRFDLQLGNYLKQDGLLYGGSAGAIICGKTIEAALYADENSLGLADLSCLDLVCGKDIFCHYHDDSKEDEFIKNYPRDLYILYEESGMFIQDGAVTPIGKNFKTNYDIVNRTK